MLFNIYTFVISVIFILLFYSLHLIKLAPNKIKILGYASISLMIIRYISVFIMFVSPGILNLYILKISYFLNFAGIPMIIFIITYVFLRRNHINFNYMFLFSLISTVVYVFLMYNCPVTIKDVNGFGYNMTFNGSMLAYWIYIIFNTFVLFCCIIFSEKPNVNKIGLRMVSFCALVAIVEYLCTVVNIRFFPENLLGDLCFIFTFIYAISKLKR